MSRSLKFGLFLFVFVVSFSGVSESRAQAPGNLQYQVANLVADVRMLDERLRQMNNELEEMRRENARLRELVRGYEESADSKLSRFATVDQLNAAVRQAVAALEKRDDVSKQEVITQVTKQIESFAGKVNKAIGSVPQIEKPDPFEKREFSDNYPKSGIPYTVQPGESIASIANKLNSRIDWIQDANKISNPRLLQVGQVIFVPQEAE